MIMKQRLWQAYPEFGTTTSVISDFMFFMIDQDSPLFLIIFDFMFLLYLTRAGN